MVRVSIDLSCGCRGLNKTFKIYITRRTRGWISIRCNTRGNLLRASYSIFFFFSRSSSSTICVVDGPPAFPPSFRTRNMLTMPPGALQGQRSAGPPKVVGEILKRGAGPAAAPSPTVAVVEGTAPGPGRRRQQPSGAPAAAAMVLAKDMATGRGKPSSGTGAAAAAAAGSHSPRAARPSAAVTVRPKPVPPSVSRKTVATVVCGSGRKPQQTANKCRRPTSAERAVKVYIYIYKRLHVYVWYLQGDIIT